MAARRIVAGALASLLALAGTSCSAREREPAAAEEPDRAEPTAAEPTAGELRAPDATVVTATAVLIPMGLTRGTAEAEPGYESLIVTLAVGATGGAVTLQFPGQLGTSGQLSISEGRTYDAKLSYLSGGPDPDWRDPTQIIEGSGFLVSPGLTMCGVVGEGDRVYTLQAHVQIPKGTTPATLSVENFPDTDLTRIAGREVCTPDVTGLPSAADPMTLHASTPTVTQRVVGTATADIAPVGFGEGRTVTTLEVERANTSRLDGYDVKVVVFAFDADGVVRQGTSGYDGISCRGDGFGSVVTLGPGQTERAKACLPQRSARMAALEFVWTDEDDITETAFLTV